jgi:hypothetical protein
MARLPKFSKYCWVWCSGAIGSVNVSVKVNPWNGCWVMPSTRSGCGMPAMSRMVGPMSVAWVNRDRRRRHP